MKKSPKHGKKFYVGLLLFMGGFLLMAKPSWAPPMATTLCAPPTPEIPGSIAPFLAAVALGAIAYWRARRKD